MISRGVQRISTLSQTMGDNGVILFDTPLFRWPTSGNSPPPISYSGGIFTIPQATLNDYLVLITVPNLAFADYYRLRMSSFFLVRLVYSYGEVTEGCTSGDDTSTGISIGYKTIHVTRKSPTDVLQVMIIFNSFYTSSYLMRPMDPDAPSIKDLILANASVIIIGI